MEFRPKDLLLGATSAVLFYNCSPRLLAVLFSSIFGIPLIGKFGDFRGLAPGNVGRRALRTFARVCRTLGNELKTTKTDRRQKITSLRLRGALPSPANNMLLSITLTEEKATTWSTLAHRVLSTGSISRAELESAIGRLLRANLRLWKDLSMYDGAPLRQTTDRTLSRNSV